MSASTFDSTEFLVLLNLVICNTFSEVFAFLPSFENPNSKLLGVALAQCMSAGSTSLLPQALPDVIFGKYESLVSSALWDRHPTTVKLKQICAYLRVRTFIGFP